MTGAFVVTSEGVYRHQIGGIYSSLELATKVADLCAEQDQDDYHEYEVREFIIDQLPKFQDDVNIIDEPDALYSARKTGVKL